MKRCICYIYLSHNTLQALKRVNRRPFLLELTVNREHITVTHTVSSIYVDTLLISIHSLILVIEASTIYPPDFHLSVQFINNYGFHQLLDVAMFVQNGIAYGLVLNLSNTDFGCEIVSSAPNSLFFLRISSCKRSTSNNIITQ